MIRGVCACNALHGDGQVVAFAADAGDDHQSGICIAIGIGTDGLVIFAHGQFAGFQTFQNAGVEVQLGGTALAALQFVFVESPQVGIVGDTGVIQALVDVNALRVVFCTGA